MFVTGKMNESFVFWTQHLNHSLLFPSLLHTYSHTFFLSLPLSYTHTVTLCMCVRERERERQSHFLSPPHTVYSLCLSLPLSLTHCLARKHTHAYILLHILGLGCALRYTYTGRVGVLTFLLGTLLRHCMTSSREQRKVGLLSLQQAICANHDKLVS